MKSTIKRAGQFPPKRSALLRIISALFICFFVFSCFTGCNDTVVATQGNTVPDRQQNSVPVTSETLNVGCSREDSLNPFYMTTDLNSALVSLVFEPLFYVDDSFCAVNGLALSYEHKDKTLTVKLDTSAAFSDGVQFSSTDVVYSFSEAKKSANYVNELANITSAAAQGTDTVVFTLDSPYRFAADSLSFPIVKASSADTEKSVPLGTGLYSYNTSGENIKLNYNPYCRKPEPNIKTVNLIDIPQSSTLIHTLELGSIDKSCFPRYEQQFLRA